MFLNDETSRARRERIPARAEQSRRTCFRNCRKFRGHDRAVESGRDKPGYWIWSLRRPWTTAAKLCGRGRARHLENSEDVSFFISHRDRNGAIQRRGRGNCLRNDGLHIGRG